MLLRATEKDLFTGMGVNLPVTEIKSRESTGAWVPFDLSIKEGKSESLVHGPYLKDFIDKYLEKYIWYDDSMWFQRKLQRMTSAATGATRVLLAVVSYCHKAKIVLSVEAARGMDAATGCRTDDVGVTATAGADSPKKLREGAVGVRLTLCKIEKKVGSDKLDVSINDVARFDSKEVKSARSWVSNATLRWLKLRRLPFYPKDKRDLCMALPDDFDMDLPTYSEAVRQVVLPPRVQNLIRGTMGEYAYLEVIRLAPTNGTVDGETGICRDFIEEEVKDSDSWKFHSGSVKLLVYKPVKERSEMYDKLKSDGKIKQSKTVIIGMTPAFPFPAETLLPITYRGEDSGKIPGSVLRYEDGFEYVIPVQGLVQSKRNPMTASFVDAKWEINESIIKVNESKIKRWENDDFVQVDPIAGENVEPGFVLMGCQSLQEYGTIFESAEMELARPGCCAIL